jgi:hypothetical protein
MNKIIWGCILALLLATGCSQNKKNNDETAKTTSASATTTAKAKALKEDADFETMTPGDMEKFQHDMRLSARMENGAVRINVRNMTDKEIGIKTYNFALLQGNKTIEPAPMREFPEVSLKPGEFATGLIAFNEVSNPVGMYCIFRHTQTQPSRCTVRPAKSATATEKSVTTTGEAPVIKKSKALTANTTTKKESRAAISQKATKPTTKKTPSASGDNTESGGYMAPNPLGD